MPAPLDELLRFTRAHKRYFVVPLLIALAAIAIAVVLARNGGSPHGYELF